MNEKVTENWLGKCLGQNIWDNSYDTAPLGDF